MLHLKRLFPFHKISKHVQAAPVIDLEPYCVQALSNSSARYALFGVTEHSGGAHGGHYVAHTYSGAGYAAFGQNVDLRWPAIGQHIDLRWPVIFHLTLRAGALASFPVRCSFFFIAVLS